MIIDGVGALGFQLEYAEHGLGANGAGKAWSEGHGLEGHT